MSALSDIFTAIANAIRSKNGSSDTYTPLQMASAITNIPGGFTETDLWINPNPSSSFSEQTITLSESMSNYNRVRIYFKVKSDVSVDSIYFDFDTTHIEYYIASTNINRLLFTIGCRYSSSGYARGMFFINSSHENYTKLYAGPGHAYPGRGATIWTEYVVPTKICGLS